MSGGEIEQQDQAEQLFTLPAVSASLSHNFRALLTQLTAPRAVYSSGLEPRRWRNATDLPVLFVKKVKKKKSRRCVPSLQKWLCHKLLATQNTSIPLGA